MSVLIKGMRMPENCIKCPMQFGGMCYVMPAEVDESRVAPTVEEALKQGKPDWCPLVEISEPHGRLIDADALIEFCAERWIPLNIDAVNMQPTIQPEKAQLSQEGTTSDLISRTETVKHLRRMLESTVPNTDYDEGFIDGVEFGVSTVSTMPSIQPVATDICVGDTISRQAAIDAAKDWYEGLICGSVNGLIKRLNALPTAQPEPQWIPVSERLPRDGSWNIFTDGKNISVERYKADAIDHFFPNGRWFDLEDAIAWMSLPEPYNGRK